MGRVSGLWLLLEKMQYMTGETPKEYVEMVLRKELECTLGNLDSTMFDLDLIRTRYGEGSEVHMEIEKTDTAEHKD